MALEDDSALQHRRHRPTGTAQVDKQRLRKRPATGRAETGLRFAADQLTGPGVTFPSLAVQRLYTGEQTGSEPEPGQHAEKLHRVLPPMAEQRP
ncbi:hypothetical protein D3C80_1968870 [compost metagenome]